MATKSRKTWQWEQLFSGVFQFYKKSTFYSCCSPSCECVCHLQTAHLKTPSQPGVVLCIFIPSSWKAEAKWISVSLRLSITTSMLPVVTEPVWDHLLCTSSPPNTIFFTTYLVRPLKEVAELRAHSGVTSQVTEPSRHQGMLDSTPCLPPAIPPTGCPGH